MHRPLTFNTSGNGQIPFFCSVLCSHTNSPPASQPRIFYPWSRALPVRFRTPFLFQSLVSSSHRVSRTCPPTSNIYPLRKTGSLLAFYIHNVGIASTSAAHAIFLDRVPGVPVLVFFFPFLLVEGGRLEERGSRGYLPGGGICGTMLNGGMSVAEVAEVVDVFGGEESACGKGVDWCITPLSFVSIL